jgi:ATP-dependent DNA ligase
MGRFNQQDVFVIGGYIPSGQNFSALLIGYEQGSDLLFIKRLVVGLSPQTCTEVFEAITGLQTPNCPFSNVPASRITPHQLIEAVMRQCVWVKRRCEVAFMERTKSGRLRHAEFRRLI